MWGALEVFEPADEAGDLGGVNMRSFYYTTYTEWRGDDYETITKIYAVLPQDAQVSIAKSEDWDGCHWSHPSIVYADSTKGINMSDEANLVINALQAECIDDENEDEEEICEERSLLQQWLIDKSR